MPVPVCDCNRAYQLAASLPHCLPDWLPSWRPIYACLSWLLLSYACRLRLSRRNVLVHTGVCSICILAVCLLPHPTPNFVSTLIACGFVHSFACFLRATRQLTSTRTHSNMDFVPHAVRQRRRPFMETVGSNRAIQAAQQLTTRRSFVQIIEVDEISFSC